MSNCSAASRREPPASTKPMTRLLNSPGYGPRKSPPSDRLLKPAPELGCRGSAARGAHFLQRRQRARRTLLSGFERSASADVGCSRLHLGFGASCRPRRELQHGRKLFLREACQQDGMTIDKFNRVVMDAGGLFVDLSENRCGMPHASLRPTEEVAVCDEKSVRKSDFGSGQRQTATFRLSGAANPRVPAPKLCVTSLSPTAAGRDFTFCRL
jgi:hypothetical protein